MVNRRGRQHDQVDQEGPPGQPHLVALPVEVGDRLPDLGGACSARTPARSCSTRSTVASLSPACWAISRIRYGCRWFRLPPLRSLRTLCRILSDVLLLQNSDPRC